MIDYCFTNDYMFRAILQENTEVLTALVCSLLHLKPSEVTSVVITNPIKLGEQDYSEAKPVIQIGFLDFTLFPEHPEFYVLTIRRLL